MNYAVWRDESVYPIADGVPAIRDKTIDGGRYWLDLQDAGGEQMYNIGYVLDHMEMEDYAIGWTPDSADSKIILTRCHWPDILYTSTRGIEFAHRSLANNLEVLIPFKGLKFLSSSTWDLTVSDGGDITFIKTFILPNYTDSQTVRILKDKFGLNGQKGQSGWGTVYSHSDGKPKKAWFFSQPSKDLKIYMAVRRD